MSGKKTNPTLASLKEAGDAALENSDFEAAQQLYTQALAIAPNNAELYKCLGRVYHDQGQLETAETFYVQALEKDHKYWTAHHNLGAIFEARQDLERAIEHYKKAALLNPDQILSYICLATSFNVLKQPILSNYYLQQAYALEPENYRILYSHAYMLQEKGDYESAIKLFQQMLINTPEKHLANVYYYLAYCNHQLSNNRIKAIEYYHCYLYWETQKSRKRWAYCQLAKLYQAEKQYMKAIDCCYHAAENLEEDADEFERLNEFASLFSYWTVTPLLSFGIKRLSEYAVAHPSSSLAHYFLAFCFNTSENYEKAIKHAQISIRLDPSHPRAYYQLAAAYHHIAFHGNGQYEDCIATLKKIIEIDPVDHYQIYERLASIYRRQGQHNKARLADRKAEKLKTLNTPTINHLTAPREGERT